MASDIVVASGGAGGASGGGVRGAGADLAQRPAESRAGPAMSLYLAVRACVARACA